MYGEETYQGKIAPFSPDLCRLSLDPAPLTCAICGEPCRKLLVMSGAPIGRPGMQIQIIRCLNCVFWGPCYVFFEEHEPVAIRFDQGQNHHLMKEMASSTPVQASLQWTTVPAASLTPWDTFAGGDPKWIQSPEWPACPQCKDDMDFILQLSSETLDEGLDQLEPFYIQLEYGATLYFFFCHRCRVACSVTQCS